MYSGTIASGIITAECTEQEFLYSSTLYLHYGETLPDNSPLTVMFKCGIIHPAYDGRMKYSESSVDILFAGNVPTGIIIVVQNKSESFLCITSGSRPKATVHWFLANDQVAYGIQDVIRSDNSGVEYVESNLTLTPSDDKHHNMTLHCQAFTTDNSHYLVSTELKLFVQVPVLQIDLQMNGMPITNKTITVVSGLSITFMCVSGLSRPAATFLWYQGNDLRGIGPNLTLTPTNKGHGKALYCKAYNTDINSVVYSMKPILKIKGLPEQPEQFTVKLILQNAVIFTWVPGSSDGYKQTFVLEGSFAEQHRWEEMTTVSEDYCRSMGIVDSISSGTSFMFRIYAYTSIGNGSYADNVLSVTTLQCLVDSFIRIV
ncbi:hypothetical protein CHS0354_006375 [Potamilus streckersoni]|uniref:Ig-like domain-containing protein n=1 Tax=Potamilus streckersoni TaxID=2493646 RepID=A0AAE0SFE4_9BIVA|nr:hypothetical protein CHS0354_006375 [Potamilus streckersoni]